MSENRHPWHRETIQALVGVSVIAVGLVATVVLHVTHDGDPPVPRPAPHATATQLRPGFPVVTPEPLALPGEP